MDIKILRQEIDHIDKKILEYLVKRNNISKKIGEYKKINGLTPLQKNRRNDVLNNRKTIGKTLGLNEIFIENIRNIIHKESLNMQK